MTKDILHVTACGSAVFSSSSGLQYSKHNHGQSLSRFNHPQSGVIYYSNGPMDRVLRGFGVSIYLRTK